MDKKTLVLIGVFTIIVIVAAGFVFNSTGGDFVGKFYSASVPQPALKGGVTLVLDDFGAADWTLKYSGGCNNNEARLTDDPAFSSPRAALLTGVSVASSSQSYYLKAGAKKQRRKKCKAFIIKTFDVSGGETLSWKYYSRESAHKKRYFQVFVNGKKVWSQNRVKPGEWKTASVPLSGDGPFTVKLQVYFKGAWTASTSGWFDKVEIQGVSSPDIDKELLELELAALSKPDPNALEYAKGDVILKFDYPVEVDTIASPEEGEVFVVTGSQELDNYLNGLGLTSFEKVFEEEYSSEAGSASGFMLMASQKQTSVGGISSVEGTKGVAKDLVETEGDSSSGGSEGITTPEYLFLWYAASYNADKDPVVVANDLIKLNAVATAEPNYYHSLLWVPNDPGASSPGLFDTNQRQHRQEHLYDISAIEAWNNPRGDMGSNIIIAIIDTGVDITHPDLDEKIIFPRDIVNDDNNPEDDIRYDTYVGHGTQCAGLAAAETDVQSPLGVAGVCPNCKIIPIKITNNLETLELYSSRAIHLAVALGADVISCSFGDPPRSDLIKAAVNYATAVGVIVVAGSGNTGVEEHMYPASFDNVISVSASSSTGNLAYFATWSDQVDIAAPGLGIGGITTMPGGGYDRFIATSMATPIVAGAIGYMLSEAQNIPRSVTLNPIRTLLKSTADPISKRTTGAGASGPLTEDINVNFGKLNLKAAVEKDSDNDGLTDLHEYRFYTSITNPDSDNDGLKDGEEVDVYNTDPNNPDSDGDLLSDGDEVNTHGTDPNEWDSDEDGLYDGKEINIGCDPLNEDSDGDGLTDGEEVNTYNTDPNKWDYDGDGFNDGAEVDAGSDPSNPNSVPGGEQEEVPEAECANDPDCPPGYSCENEQCVESPPEPTEEDSDGDGWDDLYDYKPYDATKWRFPAFWCCPNGGVYSWQDDCANPSRFGDPDGFQCDFGDSCKTVCEGERPVNSQEVWSGSQDADQCRCFRVRFN